MHPRIVEFIEALPPPPPDASFGGRDNQRAIMMACKKLLETSNEWYYALADDVRVSLYALAVAGMGDREPWEFASQLAAFCLSQKHLLQGDSAAAQKLQKYQWIATGKCDENDPGLPTPNIAAGTDLQAGQDVAQVQLYRRGPHEFLPKNPDTYRICASCAAPDANLRCGDCLRDFDWEFRGTFETYYCNTDCQRNHKDIHDALRRDRKNIFRAAALLQDLFLVYKEELYSERLEDVSEEDGILVFHHGDLAKAVSEERTIFRRFPSALTSSDEQVRLALLWGQSHDVILNFKWIIENIIGNVSRIVKFVLYTPKNVNIPTKRLIHDDATSGPKVQNLMFHAHTVIKAMLYSGETVAIDLAAGQFGWREAVAPWDHWCRCRAITLSQELPLCMAQDMVAQSSLAGNRLARAVAQVAPPILNTMMISDLLYNMRCWGFTELDRLHELTRGHFNSIRASNHLIASNSLQNKLQSMMSHEYGQMSFSPRGSSIFLRGYPRYILEVPAHVAARVEPHVHHNQEVYSLPALHLDSDYEDEEEALA